MDRFKNMILSFSHILFTHLSKYPGRNQTARILHRQHDVTTGYAHKDLGMGKQV